MVDGPIVGRTDEHLSTPRLILDSVFEEFVRAGLGEPLVLEQAPKKAPCSCTGEICFREGVFGFIRPEQVDKLCSSAEQPSGGRGLRLKDVVDVHNKCDEEFRKERFTRPDEPTYELAMEDVEAWVLCMVDKLVKRAIFAAR